MRGIQDSSIFLEQFHSKVSKALQERFLVLRNQVVDISTSGREYRFELRFLKVNELTMLAIFQHYAPVEFQWELRFAIEQITKRLPPEERQLILWLTFAHRGEVELWLIENNLWSTREFFGNILPNGLQKTLTLRLRKIIVRVEKPQRKRGYNDKGSRAKDPYWKYARNQREDTEQMYEIYQERQSVDDHISILKGWFQ